MSTKLQIIDTDVLLGPMERARKTKKKTKKKKKRERKKEEEDNYGAMSRESNGGSKTLQDTALTTI